MAGDPTAMESHIDAAHRAATTARDTTSQQAAEPIEVRRFREAADLSDACARLSPFRQEHFVLSFDSFDDYAAWRTSGSTSADC